MPVTRDMLVDELQHLLRLTAFEQTIAAVRRTQARTPALEQELAANGRKAGERKALLVQAITRVGGVPDVVGSTLGRVGALTTAQLNQVQTLQGALLGDLTLEHQLRERTRYARTLARTLGEEQVLPVLDRLETAHSATIEWLEARLAEVGRTGTSLLRQTPLQAVTGLARRIALAPLAATTGTVNQATALLARIGATAPAPLQDLAQGTLAASDAAVETGLSTARTATQHAQDAAVAAGTGVEALADEAVEVVRDAAGDVAGRVAGAAATATGTVQDAAGTATRTVQDAAATAGGTAEAAAATAAGTAEDAAAAAGGTVVDLAARAEDAAERLTEVDRTASGAVAHPFAGYEKLTGDRVMAHVRDTDDVDELQQILAFETAHKARKGVLAAVQERLTQLSAAV